VIVEKIEGVPLPPAPKVASAPPAPTVIEYGVAPQTENEVQVLKPPAPPPPA
jgi:hypothetical protein